MRRVANALDTGPASLYVYVANRDELHALLFDAAIATIAVEETDPARWREQLHGLAERMVKMMVGGLPGHRDAGHGRDPDRRARDAPHRVHDVAPAGGRHAGPGAGLRARPRVDVHDRDRLRAALYQELYADPDHEQREIERLRSASRALSADRFPTMASVAALMVRGTGEERFGLGLDIIINGLLATPTDGRLSEGYGPPDDDASPRRV